MVCRRWSAFFFLSVCASALGETVEQFHEELSIKTFSDGKVSSQFSFKTLLKGVAPKDPRTLGVDDDSQHYTLFPLALGQILREYGVSELHLTLNAGNWNYDRWGYPEERGVGSGAELWAWMGDGAPTSVDNRWNGFRNALAGLFCASLGSMDEKRTTSPSRSFAPEGALPDWGVAHQIRHASLPSEHVCTENLTPFLKLLPCKSLSGIASLLNPHRLFDADWHGMGIHVLWREAQGIEVRLTFQSVSDPLRSSSVSKKDWSLLSLFDRTIDRTCPVALSSRVLVALPLHEMYGVAPDPTVVNGNYAIYDVISSEKPLNVAMNWPAEFQYPEHHNIDLVPIFVQRSLKGSSQERAQLSVVIKNREPTEQKVLYLETMPWLVQFYLHTMKTTVNGVLTNGIISNISYIPAVPHSRPTTFQTVVTLPARSKVHLTIDIAKAFLRYTEHPPDAQRGWDLPPAIFTPLKVEANRSSVASRDRIYSSSLLVDLATPDFSMPYNVIIFSCSLIAFIFGSVFNLLTRKFVIVHLMSDKQE